VNEIIQNLWVSDWMAARDSTGFHIVTVAADSPFVGSEHFNLADGPGNSHDEFHGAVSAVVHAYTHGKRVLVHCIAGQSRSAAVAVSALMAIRGLNWCEAYDLLVKQKPNIRIHPAFADFLVPLPAGRGYYDGLTKAENAAEGERRREARV
jgi:hypothetical protein